MVWSDIWAGTLSRSLSLRKLQKLRSSVRIESEIWKHLSNFSNPRYINTCMYVKLIYFLRTFKFVKLPSGIPLGKCDTVSGSLYSAQAAFYRPGTWYGRFILSRCLTHLLTRGPWHSTDDFEGSHRCLFVWINMSHNSSELGLEHRTSCILRPDSNRGCLGR